MHIGFVYDLRDDYRAKGYDEEAVAEFDTPETIDGIALGLEKAGCTVDRVGHGRALAERLTRGDRFDLVFSIAEGLKGRNREAQVSGLCELYDQPYVFSDTLTLCVALDKAMAKRVVRDAGVPTSDFVLLKSVADAAAVKLPFPLFVKPNQEGTGKGCDAASRVNDLPGLEAAAGRLIERFDQPVIVEPWLPGREFTVGITGTGRNAQVIGVMEIQLLEDADAGVYSLLSKEECESRVKYCVATGREAEEAAAVGLAAYRALDCRDGGRIDVRSDARGRPLFMEANPLAGLHPTHSDLPIIADLVGYGYERLMADILGSAASRARLTLPAAMAHAAAG